MGRSSTEASLVGLSILNAAGRHRPGITTEQGVQQVEATMHRQPRDENALPGARATGARAR